MLISSKKSYDIREQEVTPEEIYKERRSFFGKSAALTLGFASLGLAEDLSPNQEQENKMLPDPNIPADSKSARDFNAKSKDILLFTKNPNFGEGPITPYIKATSYNNFYEFGMQKDDPKKRANILKTSPWDIVIDGEVQNPITLSLEDILKKMPLEERIYRLRCVEAWSMNIPWIGFELAALLALAKPTSQAKYVRFESIVQEDMPAIKNPALANFMTFPYTEGLRIDEATHPLTLIAVGMYGRILPNQNGAPLRLVVPWKYGFKSIKSIKKITLTKEMPRGTWQKLTGNEYGFYANVNPNVPHPRWSQASERFIGAGSAPEREKTKMFNGYGNEVARLYANMDLEKNF